MAGLTRFRYDIFLSHSSADKAVVRELAERLRAAGLRVWLDAWIIQPGDLISHQIEQGLEQSALLLFCMSAHAFGSDWASLESHSAIFRDPLNRDRRFVPLRLDDAPIKAMLSGYAYLDWRPGADREAEWGRLLAICGVGADRAASGDGLAEQQALVGAAVESAPAVGSRSNPGTKSLARPPKAVPAAPIPPAASAFAAPASPASRPPEPHPRPLAAPGTPSQPLGCLDLFHPGPVNSVGWSPDGTRLVSGGSDGTVRLWEAHSGRALAVLEGHKGWVWSVGWSPDGARLVSGGEDGTVRLWEAQSGRALSALEGHEGWVRSVGWSPDGTRVVSGGEDGSVRLWEAQSGRELAVLEGHEWSVTSVGWSPNGARLVSGGGDGAMRLWEAQSGGELAVLIGHKGWVWSVGWSPDGARLVSGGDDGTVRLWEAQSGRALAVLEGHEGPVRSVGWSPDGARLVSGGDDGTVRLWEAQSGQALAVLKGHKAQVWSVGWSPDGARLVSGGEDGTVRLWEAQSGHALAVFKGHKGWVVSVGWSPDGARLVSGGEDGTVRLWEAHSGRALAVLEGHKGWVWSVGWSPDGARLVSGGDDGTVRLWEAHSGRELAVLKGHKGWVWSVGWSPDGARLVSGGDDGTVRLWEAQSGRALAVLKGHKGWVWSVGWSPDGTYLVSGGQDGTVRLWEAQTGRALAVHEGHEGMVRSVGWSPDGAHLISGGSDGTVRLWEAQSGSALAVLEGHKGTVRSVGWRPDGAIWSVGEFGLLLLWPADLATTPPPGDGAESRTYTNAKVLVVGDSGAGKTGLSGRLVTGTFQPSDSTVGAWATQWSLPQPDAAHGEPEREIWLWDFGGQADQRLIHQLYLDRAALVLLLFNAEGDEVIEGLRDWQVALNRTLREPPPQLLVAARVDAGFGASRSLLQRFAAENGCRFLETSARTGEGCPDLIAAIQEAIAWDQLPRHTSPRLFQWIREELLRLRDGGEALLTYKDLRERLRQRLVSVDDAPAGLQATGIDDASLDDASLDTVLGLLDGPGVLKQLRFGGYVLLKPEWLGVYGQAVVHALRQAEPQLGTLPLGAISGATLPFAVDQPRLPPDEEELLLGELERQLQERQICLRLGGQLVFPSYCGRERPASPALPPVFMSYTVRGWLNDIHASLVVSLAETRVFDLKALWRDAAEFHTRANPALADGPALAVRLQRDNASEGTITVHTSAELSRTEQAQFALLIQEQLAKSAEAVQRLRHWLCPHCHAPKGNGAVLMEKLDRLGSQAQVRCDGCDRDFFLYDDLERLLADPETRHRAETLSQQALPRLTARNKGQVLVLEVKSRIKSANQKYLDIPGDEDDGIDLQVEFTDDNGIGSGCYLYLQLKAGSSHLSRRADGREIFRIKKPRWVTTWTQQPFPVMLVIGREADATNWHRPSWNRLRDLGLADPEAHDPELKRLRWDPRDPSSASSRESRTFPDVRWMEISSLLKRELAAGRRHEEIKQIEFEAEPLDLASVLRWRNRIREGYRG